MCIIFTDGESDDPDAVRAAAKAWNQNGATIMAVGIGSMISDAGLNDTTGTEGSVLRVANFNDIHNHASSMIKEVCEVIVKGKYHEITIKVSFGIFRITA